METYDRYVDQHREVFIEELKAFCTQPSIAATGEGNMANVFEILGDRRHR